MRAFRRHHYKRRKEAVKKLWKNNDWNIDKDYAAQGKYANTRKPCNCWVCRNPRKLGKISLQEKRNIIKEKNV